MHKTLLLHIIFMLFYATRNVRLGFLFEKGPKSSLFIANSLVHLAIHGHLLCRLLHLNGIQ